MYLLRMTISLDPEDVTKFYRATESDLTIKCKYRYDIRFSWSLYNCIKATKRFVEAVIGSEPFGDDGPQAHKYVAEGFLKHDRLQYYFDTVRNEVAKQWEILAAKESFDLFPEVRSWSVKKRFSLVAVFGPINDQFPFPNKTLP